MNLLDLARPRRAVAARVSSYDTTGRNDDYWILQPGETRVLAEIDGPGIITHIWMTQTKHYRECLLRITWDHGATPSVVCPLGDFFGLGHGIVNSYQSLLFSASTEHNNQFQQPCALNCYAPMPFRTGAKIELINESAEPHVQYFYIDYERPADPAGLAGLDYFHAEFRRAFPFCGWSPSANLGRDAWENNYVILETKGCGRYIGCNLSVTNFGSGWWGEGDDMIWVDGYHWPPSLHGTGSEDYFNQAYGMQPNAFARNGSSIWEKHTDGYQTCYVHHLENPVHFTKEIKVTIEHNHANQDNNEFSSVAYWYADRPAPVIAPPPVHKRMAVPMVEGRWNFAEETLWPGNGVPEAWTDTKRRAYQFFVKKTQAQFTNAWYVSAPLPGQTIADAQPVSLTDNHGWHLIEASASRLRYQYVCALHVHDQPQGGLVYMANRFHVEAPGTWEIDAGHDGGLVLFVNGQRVAESPERARPAPVFRTMRRVDLPPGPVEIVAALDYDKRQLDNVGMFFSWMPVPGGTAAGKPQAPERLTIR